ncbi:hypothetical protein APHAL10511_005969 [Amanita phalloides]|nr:hypothetical protein APHAL10511_005969 [Amanita phalloides]
MNPQLYPLQVNPLTGEPFLRLKRHKNIIITPPRTEDAQHLLGPLNDERVHVWLSTVPYPYLLEHAETWIALIKGKTDAILEQLESARDEQEMVFTDGCPVRYLREIGEDGREEFIGDIAMIRCNLGELMVEEGIDYDGKRAYEAKNNELAVGDARIVWSIGNFLVASQHGRGIMTDAVESVLEWAKERMNARRVVVAALAENTASLRVFAKNGFRELRVVDGYRGAKSGDRTIVLLSNVML